jgi:hypothetical protein
MTPCAWCRLVASRIESLNLRLEATGWGRSEEAIENHHSSVHARLTLDCLIQCDLADGGRKVITLRLALEAAGIRPTPKTLGH